MYTQLLWAVTFGYLVFNNVPNHWTLAGAAIVVGSGLYLLYREQKVRGTVAPSSPVDKIAPARLIPAPTRANPRNRHVNEARQNAPA